MLLQTPVSCCIALLALASISFIPPSMATSLGGGARISSDVPVSGEPSKASEQSVVSDRYKGFTVSRGIDQLNVPNRAEAPIQKAEALAQKAETPAQKTEAPAQKTEAPVQKTEAPVQKNEAPVQKAEAPAEKAEAPTQKAEAPTQKAEAPVQKTEAPTRQAEVPAQKAESSAQITEALAEKTEIPTQKAGAPAESLDASYAERSTLISSSQEDAAEFKWQLHGKKSLKGNLAELLGAHGWNLAWGVGHDYQVGVDAQLVGTLDGIVAQIVRAYAKRGVLLKLTWFDGNQVLQVERVFSQNELKEVVE